MFFLRIILVIILLSLIYDIIIERFSEKQNSDVIPSKNNAIVLVFKVLLDAIIS